LARVASLGLADYSAACRNFVPASMKIHFSGSRSSATNTLLAGACSERPGGDAHLRTSNAGGAVGRRYRVSKPRKIKRSGIWDAVEGARHDLVHKEKVLDQWQRRYPAGHYVMVDDKANLLAAMKQVLGARELTRFSCARALCRVA